MAQNLLIPSNSSAGRTSGRGYLLRHGYVGFRFVRYQCSPWFVLATAPLKLLFATGVERSHVQIRCCKAIARIDFVQVYGLLNDLLW